MEAVSFRRLGTLADSGRASVDASRCLAALAASGVWATHQVAA